MNYSATVINCLTAGYPEGAFTPVYFDSDREVIEAALKIIGTRPPQEARVMRIRNTLTLEELEVSEACLKEKRGPTPFSVLGAPHELAYDAAGNLTPL
jgi:hypothetical protein